MIFSRSETKAWYWLSLAVKFFKTTKRSIWSQNSFFILHTFSWARKKIVSDTGDDLGIRESDFQNYSAVRGWLDFNLTERLIEAERQLRCGEDARLPE